jgi:2OG-Fe(II) oxygenase superfamily
MKSNIPPTVILDTNANTIINLFKALGLPNTKSFFRSVYYSHANYPLLTAKDIIGILEQTYRLPCLACKADPALLDQVEYPALTKIMEPDKEMLVVILGVDHSTITYHHPLLGIISEDRDLFYAKWLEMLILVEMQEDTREENYRENAEMEREGIAEYSQHKVREIDDFLAKEECDFIVDFCESDSLFDRSTIGKSRAVTYLRTSFSASLHDLDKNRLNALFDKVSGVLNVQPGNIEFPQCVKYNVTEDFKIHFDVDENLKRLFTVLIYLNDDFEGGETYFPELSRTIIPKKGKALIFENMDRGNNTYIYAAHAGLPVKKGVKYACNVWVGDSPQRRVKNDPSQQAVKSDPSQQAISASPLQAEKSNPPQLAVKSDAPQ